MTRTAAELPWLSHRGFASRGRTRRSLAAVLCLGMVIAPAGCGSGAVAPTPGAAFTGAIETGAGATAGTVAFTISADGASITDLEVSLTGVACDGLSIGSTRDVYGGAAAAIESGRFGGAIPPVGAGGLSQSSNYRLDTSPADFPVVEELPGRIEGEFASAVAATGTITIWIRLFGLDRGCELGTFPWSAEAS